MVERNGNVIGRVIKNTSKNELTPKILEFVDKDAILYTDEWQGYNEINKMYYHYTIDHSKGQYGKGRINTN